MVGVGTRKCVAVFGGYCRRLTEARVVNGGWFTLYGGWLTKGGYRAAGGVNGRDGGIGGYSGPGVI